jgi:RimJ/RimL family protein N-acetyltransferase
MTAAAAGIDGLAVLEAHIAPDNQASRRLAEGLGFAETRMAEDEAWDGVISTMVVYERSL